MIFRWQTLVLLFLTGNLAAQSPTFESERTALRGQVRQGKKEQALIGYKALYDQAKQDGDILRESQAGYEYFTLNMQLESSVPALNALYKNILSQSERIETQLGKAHKETAWWYFLLSKICAQTDRGSKSQDYFKQAKAVLDGQIQETEYGAASYYFYKAAQLLQNSKPNEGLVHFEKAKRLMEQTYGVESREMAEMSLVEYTFWAAADSEAVKYLDKAAEILNRLPQKNPALWARLYFLYGYAEQIKGPKTRPEQMIAHYEKSIELSKGRNAYASAATVLLNLGAYYKDNRPRIHQDRERYELYASKAEYYLREAIKTFESSAIRPRNNLALCYLNLGNLLLETGYERQEVGQGQFTDKADAMLDCFRRGIYELFPDETPKADPYALPDENAPLPFSVSPFMSLRLLGAQIRFYQRMYQYTPKAEFLTFQTACLRLMERLALDKEAGTVDIDDKTSWLNHLQEIYAQQIDVILQGSETERTETAAATVFDLMEKSKSLMLLAALQNKENRLISGLPSAVSEEENRLRYALEANSKQLSDAFAERDPVRIEQLKKRRFELHQELQHFGKKLETEYPQYSQATRHRSVISLADFQKTLDSETVFLHFLHRQDNMLTLQEGNTYYILCIWREGTELRAVRGKTAYGEPDKKDDNGVYCWLKRRVQALRHTLDDWSELQSDPNRLYREFVFHAKGLYDSLGLEQLLPPGKRRLSISPDGELNDIPFEVLLSGPVDTASVNFASLPYLLRDYALSYTYSATLLEQNRKQPLIGNGRMAGMAASYTQTSAAGRSEIQSKQRKVLADLPGARLELQRVGEHFKGDFFTAEQASERNLRNLNFGQYSILHLAMHGLMNKDNPLASALVLTEDGDTAQDNFLYAHEIAFMDIPVDLVVLSACETGYGKFESGEGVLSLARSFMYAGVPSLVMSLWEVNDASTASIMEGFYRELSAGVGKDQALRQAKLDYLSKAKGINAHPAFWAAFVQIGNPDSLKSKGSPGIWLWGSVSLGLVLSLLAWRFGRRKRG